MGALFCGVLLMLSNVGHTMDAPAAQTLRLAAPFSDHMVIQQERPLKLCGFAAPKAEVQALFHDQSASAQADDAGAWFLTLPAPPAGGPYGLTVTAGDQRLVLNDVLCGEVWLASGQSNMEWPLAKATGPSPEALKQSHPLLRLLNVPHKVGSQGDPYAGLSWTEATPSTQAPFSAVAFHFALALQAKLGVPVGIINASWSGTNGEAWTPSEAIAAEPKLKAVHERYQNLPLDHKRMYRDGWEFRLEFQNLCLITPDGRKLYFLPKVWGSNGAEGVRSEVKRDPAGPSIYTGLVPPGAWAACKGLFDKDAGNLEPISEISFEAAGNSSFDLALVQPDIQDGDQPCSATFEPSGLMQEFRFRLDSFKQQGWGQHRPFDLKHLRGLQFRVHSPNQFPDQPGLLYDSMIKPLAGFELAGALWYQGESNVGRYREYSDLLKALVGGWREALGQSLGFVVVQLPEYKDPEGEHGAWDKLRAAQLKVLALPRTAVVDTRGLGELDNVHPRLKAPVGERAAEQAVKAFYGVK